MSPMRTGEALFLEHTSVFFSVQNCSSPPEGAKGRPLRPRHWAPKELEKAFVVRSIPPLEVLRVLEHLVVPDGS